MWPNLGGCAHPCKFVHPLLDKDSGRGAVQVARWASSLARNLELDEGQPTTPANPMSMPRCSYDPTTWRSNPTSNSRSVAMCSPVTQAEKFQTNPDGPAGECASAQINIPVPEKLNRAGGEVLEVVGAGKQRRRAGGGRGGRRLETHRNSSIRAADRPVQWLQ